MPARDPVLSAMYVDRFNADRPALGSSVRVALPVQPVDADVIELRDDEGNFLEFLPNAAEPGMVAIAYRLYARGLNNGVRAGEEAAWAKLRHLIGVPSLADHRAV